MDWNFGGGVNDFLVPKDHEMLDRLPLSENWLQWGKSDYESMESLSKYIVPEKNPNQEAQMGILTHTMENNGSSSSGILSEGSLHQSALLHEQPSYLLNEEVGTDHVDDIFLSSFLDEDLPAMESLNESFGFPPEFQYSSMSTDDPSIKMISDSQRVPRSFYGIKSSKYLKTDDLSASGVGKVEEFTASHSNPSTSPPAELHVSASQIEALGEETSAEESVLQELKGVMMSQLTQKTRICFRDALYRLAKNSEQQCMLTKGNVKEFTAESRPVIDEMPRSGTRKAMESETNVIDRAVANLMFNKMELNAQNFSPATSLHATPQVGDAATSLHATPQVGDAEVPMVGRAKLQGTTDQNLQSLVQ